MSALLQTDPNDALRRLLAKVDNMAVLPHVVFKVLDVTNEIDLHSSDLERAIITDPGFSAKVLTMANSDVPGPLGCFGSVKEALAHLGLKRVRDLAMNVSDFEMFVGKNDEESLRRRAWWRHSVDTAICAQWLSRATGKVPEDEAYTCGLLHYTGRKLLDRFGEGSYSECTASIRSGEVILEAEERIFGCNNIEVSVGAARRWGFPESLVQGLRFLEVPLTADTHKRERATTALASSIAKITKHGRKREDLSIPEWTLPLLDVAPEDAESIVEEGISEITASQANL